MDDRYIQLKARLLACQRSMLGYSFVLCAITVGSLIYHGFIEAAPRIVNGDPFMRPLSVEWCLTFICFLMHAITIVLLESGFRIGWRNAIIAEASAPRRLANPAAAAAEEDEKKKKKTTGGTAPPAAAKKSSPLRLVMPPRVAIGSALLFAAALMYLLFYGTVVVSDQISRHLDALGPTPAEEAAAFARIGDGKEAAEIADALEGAGLVLAAHRHRRAARRQPGDSAATASADADSAPAVADGDAQDSDGQDGHRTAEVATCEAQDPVPAISELGMYGFAELVWSVVESVVDMLVLLVTSEPDYRDDSLEGRYARSSDSAVLSTTVNQLRRWDLALLHVVGFCLGLWGIANFDIEVGRESPEARRARHEAAKRGFTAKDEKQYATESHANPQLTMEALQTLSGAKAAARPPRETQDAASAGADAGEDAAKKNQ